MINQDIQQRIEKLPAKQQAYFDDLIEQGKDCPRKTADQLRADLVKGEVDQDYILTSQLALAALSDSGSDGPLPTNSEARGTYDAKIAELREIGANSVADRLQGILDRVSVKEEAASSRAESVKAAAQQRQIKVAEDRLASYEKAYAEEKSQRIAELTARGLMDTEQAEQRFMKIEHNQLSTILKRMYGIAV